MTDRRFVRLAVAGLLLMINGLVLAASGGPVQAAGNDLGDRASLQRGAQLYMNYCAGCHSLKYLRYSRLAEDLGLSEEQVMTNLNFTGAAIGEQIHATMPAESEKWFGKVPPDLTLISRVRGNDWVYTYLKSFYRDADAALGWNNALFPNVSMPNALWELQGIQAPVMSGEGADAVVTGLELVQPGALDEAQFNQAARDITNFLAYAGEPAALKRNKLGVWVVLFLAFLTFLAWLLKQEYWKDVH